MAQGMPSKKNAEKGTLVHTGGRGLKHPLFYFIKKGTYLYAGRGQNILVTCSLLSFIKIDLKERSHFTLNCAKPNH